MNYLFLTLLLIAPFSIKPMQLIRHERHARAFLVSLIETFDQTALFEQTIMGILRSNLQYDYSFINLALSHKERVFARAKAIIDRRAAATPREIANAKAGLMLINFAGLNNIEIRKSAQDVYLKLEELNEQITRGSIKTN